MTEIFYYRIVVCTKKRCCGREACGLEVISSYAVINSLLSCLAKVWSDCKESTAKCVFYDEIYFLIVVDAN